MTIAIIGATGLVGSEIIKVLEEKNIKEISEIIFVGSKKSVGKKIKYKNKKEKIVSIKEAIKMTPKYALFSAGSKISTKYAKEFNKNKTIVIDNSSAFRMNKKIKLVVPEINGKTITKNDKIIANPNCSTIQLVMVINNIYKKRGIKRMIVSTYQSVTGTGYKAVKQLQNEEENKQTNKSVYEKKIHRNIIPKCDEFNESGYTKEEEKIIKETNKILGSNIKITATAVRVPTLGGHGESVNIELEKETSKQQVIEIIKKQKGVYVDTGTKYKTPVEVASKNEVFVSRIRKDFSQKNSYNLWVVADPLRKGAATNAVQILELLININK
ncbi:MAG: aspartate-semialdehyde dehydrogenase [Flavobacteriales bacterium]|jgi:aspartate-semialdehyde dehydrogenase|nr:aspartate-semialdehyde dehydrogenase [Flavobacteriales bacterium]|tara:strand:+ start:56919 stop:57899 length:981 start_codon:yes stop_codon:yes gene_type:complete